MMYSCLLQNSKSFFRKGISHGSKRGLNTSSRNMISKFMGTRFLKGSYLFLACQGIAIVAYASNIWEDSKYLKNFFCQGVAWHRSILRT